MLICGQEEPIRVNGQIYQLDEILGTYILADVENPKLNRYSFVWLGKWEESNPAFSRLLASILDKTGFQATWVTAYKITGDYRVRAQLYSMKRAQEGWNIHQEDDLVIATTPLVNIAVDTFRPANEKAYSGLKSDELLLLLGPAPEPEALAGDPVRQSIEWFARSLFTKIAPSWRFLEWLADMQYTLVYRADSHGGHPGLIIVGTARLPTAALLAEGIINEAKSGKDADKVWTHAPSW